MIEPDSIIEEALNYRKERDNVIYKVEDLGEVQGPNTLEDQEEVQQVQIVKGE